MKSINSQVFTVDETYCSEEYFQGMLVFQRKKNKVSGKPFLAIALDVDKFTGGKANEREVVVRKINAALGSSTRKIELRGLYSSGSMSGIICQWLVAGVGDLGQPAVQGGNGQT
jgi:hypothetical protein